MLRCYSAGRAIYSGLELDLSSPDLKEIGNALADQNGYEHRWLINPQTGEIAFWTADTGIDGQTPVDGDHGGQDVTAWCAISVGACWPGGLADG